MKEGFVLKTPSSAGEMEEINRYTRREYAPEEVYTFSLVLCDNEVDRDWERFSIPALEKLKDLFLGKTCILDHERKSANQTARIFHTDLETVAGRVTRCGEPYTRLTARAYLPRTDKTKETIELIDSGILKEVSVSCAVARSTCSVCGKERCDHRKGQTYAGKLCLRVLEDPTDAYECSFVAVPAQREAGVRKGWRAESPAAPEERLKAADANGVTLTGEEARALEEKLSALSQQARWGVQYREELEGRVLKSSRLLQPEVPADVLRTALRSLTLSDLSRLGAAYESMVRKALPPRPQLAPEKDLPGAPAGDASYRI